MLRRCERRGDLPVGARSLVVRLLAKPTSRVQLARGWAAWTIAKLSNNSAGRRITEAMWREVVRRAASDARGPEAEDRYAAELLWDLKKAFDHVVRRGLPQAAAVHGYPLGILTPQLGELRLWGRRFVSTDGLMLAPLVAACGIGAGSPWATFELQLYLATAMRAMRAQCPCVRALLLDVDDLSLLAVGGAPDAVADQLAEATETTQQLFEDCCALLFAEGPSRPTR